MRVRLESSTAAALRTSMQAFSSRWLSSADSGDGCSGLVRIEVLESVDSARAQCTARRAPHARGQLPAFSALCPCHCIDRAAGLRAQRSGVTYTCRSRRHRVMWSHRCSDSQRGARLACASCVSCGGACGGGECRSNNHTSGDALPRCLCQRCSAQKTTLQRASNDPEF